MTGFFYITGYMFGMACFPLGCGISEDTPGMGAFYFHGRPHLGTVMEAFWATHFLRSIYLKSTSCGLLPLIRFLLLCCIVMTYFDAPKVCTIRLDRLLRVNLITALTDSSCSSRLSGSLISLLGFSPYVLF